MRPVVRPVVRPAPRPTAHRATRPASGRRAASAVVTALAVLAAAPGCASWREQPVVVLQEEIDGQAVVGASAPGQSPRAVVVYFHGLYDTAAKITEGEDLSTLTDALVGAGYAVVASDAQGDSFGSPAAQEDYAALAAAATERYGVEDVFFLAESMGGLSALPLAASGRVPGLRGTAAVAPAINTGAAGFADFADDAEAAWGRPLTAADDPLALPAEDFAGQSFRFYVTPDDTVVPTDENADLFLERVAGVAGASEVACTGDHLDASCYRPQDLVDWFDGLLGPDA